MKIIVNSFTPLHVLNADGDVLYEWNPFDGEVTYVMEEKAKNSIIKDITDSYISGDLKK